MNIKHKILDKNIFMLWLALTWITNFLSPFELLREIINSIAIVWFALRLLIGLIVQDYTINYPSYKYSGKYILPYWLLLGFTIVLSCLFRGSVSFYEFVMIAIVPFVMFFIPRLIEDFPKQLVYVVGFTGVFMILTSLTITEFLIPYVGIFLNPNQVGMVSSLTFIALLVNALDSLQRASKFQLIILLICCLFTLVFVFASASTTSLFITVIESLIVLVCYLRTMNKGGGLSRFIFLVFTVCVIAFLYLSLPQDSIVVKALDATMDKLFDKYEGNQMLSQRDVIWQEIEEGASLWGSGSVPEIQQDNGVIISQAHNISMDMLSRWGYIVFYVFITFEMYLIFVAIREMVKFTKPGIPKRFVELYPAILITHILGIGQTESILYLFLLSFNVFFLCIGYYALPGKVMYKKEVEQIIVKK